MAIYNTSFMDNATNIVDLFTGIGAQVSVNGTHSPYILGYLIMFSFAFIFLVMSMRNDPLKVVIIDSFLTTILGIILWGVGMVPVFTIIIPLLLFAGSLIFFQFS